MPEEIVYKPTSEYSKDHDTPKQAQVETIIERLLKYGTMIMEGATGITSSSTFYTVPEGKTFFLVAAHMNSQLKATAVDGRADINVTGTTDSIIRHFYESTVSTIGDYQQNSVSFPVPLKFSAGFEISVSALQTQASVDIQGYEIDNEFLK